MNDQPKQDHAWIEIALAPLRAQVAQIAEDLREIRTGQTIQIADLRQRAETNREDIVRVSGVSGELSKALDRIETRIRAIGERMPSLDRLAKIEAALGERVHKAEIERVQDDVKELQADMEKREKEIDVNKTTLTSIEGIVKAVRWVGVTIAGLIILLLWQLLTGEVTIGF